MSYPVIIPKLYPYTRQNLPFSALPFPFSKSFSKIFRSPSYNQPLDGIYYQLRQLHIYTQILPYCIALAHELCSGVSELILR